MEFAINRLQKLITPVYCFIKELFIFKEFQY